MSRQLYLIQKIFGKSLIAHIVIIGLGISSCGRIPKEKLYQFKLDIDYAVQNDTLIISIKNPIQCPVRIGVRANEPQIQSQLKSSFPILMPPQGDTVVNYYSAKPMEEIDLKFSAMMGDPLDTIRLKLFNLPFLKGRGYKVIQGYDGKFSHTSDYSKYAIDFNLQEGDTVCSAADGYVVGVIQGYRVGGDSKKWREYANFITIFHPEMNLFTQYVHLRPEGSFVEVGDSVKAGEPVGLSGMTGFTDIEHLHFNVLRASSKGLVSIPVEFKGGYIGKKLRKGDLVRN